MRQIKTRTAHCRIHANIEENIPKLDQIPDNDYSCIYTKLELFDRDPQFVGKTLQQIVPSGRSSVGTCVTNILRIFPKSCPSKNVTEINLGPLRRTCPSGLNLVVVTGVVRLITAFRGEGRRTRLPVFRNQAFTPTDTELSGMRDKEDRGRVT